MADNLPVVAPQSADSDKAAAAAHEARMSFFEHLGELRKRLMYAALGIVIGAALCWAFHEEMFQFLLRPLQTAANVKLMAPGPLDIFITYIKLALAGGMILASPFVLLQLWLFVAPGLYSNEKRWIVPFIILGSGFFVAGAAFCFFLVLPASFEYLIGLTPDGVERMYSVSLYFSLIIQLMLAFGAVFELPLVMTILAAAGLFTAKQFAGFRKYWIVIAAIIGGVLTPTPDPMTQMMMAVPLMLFFEFGIWGAKLVEGRRVPATAAQS